MAGNRSLHRGGWHGGSHPGPQYHYDQVKQQMRLHPDRPAAAREAIYACRKGGTVFTHGVFACLVDRFPLGAVMNKALTLRGAQQHGVRPQADRPDGGRSICGAGCTSGWTGDVRGLKRTDVLPPGVCPLRDRIFRVERAMNHHAVVEKQADGTAFRVWTHARGVVTGVDIELGRRISEIIDNG